MKYIMNINIYNLLIGLGILIISFILARISRKLLYVFSRKKKYEDNLWGRAFIRSIANSVTPAFITIGVIIINKSAVSTGMSSVFLVRTIQVLFTLTAGIWAFYLVEIPSLWYEHQAKKTGNATNKMLAPMLKQILRIFVIAITIGSVYQTISQKPITPLLAGLGIVGAAIALAAQDTFKNFFGSFVLAGDKPFEIGERVLVEGHDGVVDSIGMRSTRLRTLDDHLVTIPNGHLANIVIQNIGKRNHIKRQFIISITYNTPPEKMNQALDIITTILKNHEGMQEDFPPRVFFKDFAASSLDIMVIYWYHPAAYWEYLEFSQKVNLEILNQFNEANIEFAFPTQTIHLNKEDNNL